jgi:hypothetical protein
VLDARPEGADVQHRRLELPVHLAPGRWVNRNPWGAPGGGPGPSQGHQRAVARRAEVQGQAGSERTLRAGPHGCFPRHASVLSSSPLKGQQSGGQTGRSRVRPGIPGTYPRGLATARRPLTCCGTGVPLLGTPRNKAGGSGDKAGSGVGVAAQPARWPTRRV